MGRATWALVLSAAGLLLAASCGGSAAAQSPSTLAPVVATLPPANTPAATNAPPTTSAPTATSSATPARTASPAPATATATASSSGTSSATLLAQGKVVFQTVGGVGCQSCHGPDGKGGVTKDGSSAPNITAATEQKLRDALRGGVPLMSNLKLSDADIDAVMTYLRYLDLQ